MFALVAHFLPTTVLVVALSLGGAPSVAVWPLDPRPTVVHEFDPPPTPYTAGHRGVDLRGRPGQAVLAVRDGTITYAGMLAGRGVVVVDHGDTRTTYQPVDASVRVGEAVAAGQVVGTLQAGGSHCMPRSCLHLGLLRGETYLDPLSLLGPRPVRLLPLWSVGQPRVPWLAGRHRPWPVRPALPVTRAGAPAGMPGAGGPW